MTFKGNGRSATEDEVLSKFVIEKTHLGIYVLFFSEGGQRRLVSTFSTQEGVDNFWKEDALAFWAMNGWGLVSDD